MLKRVVVAAAGGVGAVLAARRLIAMIRDGPKGLPSEHAHLYILERSQLIPAPLHEVFPFFEEPRNLARITPDWMGFDILGLEHPVVQRGTRIEYRIRPLRVPQRWTTEIVEYQPQRRFVDVQAKGPYRYWRHEHTFEDAGDRTLMRDRVAYQMPLGALGRLAHFLFVSRRIREIFDYREKAIREAFPGRAASQ